MAVVHVTYCTDPACPRSWAAEPALTRLIARFGAGVRISYVMGAPARHAHDPLAMLGAVLDAAAHSAMPVDPRLWLEQPPAGSQPAGLAVKAAAEQGLDGAYLRRARVALMCERRPLDGTDALVALARDVAGLDAARFAVDLGSSAIVESLGADLERARGGDGAPPWWEVDGERIAVEELEQRVLAAGHAPVAAPGVEQAVSRLGPLATVEVGAVCDLPGPRAAAELWRLAADWRVRADRILTGELWSAA